MGVSALDKTNIRLAFHKTGRAVFISHLALMRVFQRAFYRAQLPLRYTEGFNPHAYVSIALPLPLGMESLCERLDFGVAAEFDTAALPGVLNNLLPEGIVVTGAEAAKRPISEAKFVDTWFDADTSCGAQRLRELFSGPVIVDKRTKKGMAKLDIAPLIKHIEFADDGGRVTGRAVICAQAPGLSPEYIEAAAREYADPDAVIRFVRKKLLDADEKLFDCM